MYSTGIALPPLLEFHGAAEAYSTPDSCTVDQSIGMYQPTRPLYLYLNVSKEADNTPDSLTFNQPTRTLYRHAKYKYICTLHAYSGTISGIVDYKIGKYQLIRTLHSSLIVPTDLCIPVDPYLPTSPRTRSPLKLRKPFWSSYEIT